MTQGYLILYACLMLCLMLLMLWKKGLLKKLSIGMWIVLLFVFVGTWIIYFTMRYFFRDEKTFNILFVCLMPVFLFSSYWVVNRIHRLEGK
jgi:hypothetical protein